jgi:hypothetical protein
MKNHINNGLSSTPRTAFTDSGKGQFNPPFCALCREKQVEYHCQNCGTAALKVARFLPTRQEFNELTRFFLKKEKKKKERKKEKPYTKINPRTERNILLHTVQCDKPRDVDSMTNMNVGITW